LFVTICLPVLGGLAVLFLVAGFFFAAGMHQPVGWESILQITIVAVLLAAGASFLAGLAVRRLVLLPVEQCAAVAERAAAGDFSVRLRGRPRVDELGRCFSGINTLIATIAGHVARLHELNATAEAMTNALNKDEVVRIVAEVIEDQFRVCCLGIFPWDPTTRHGGAGHRFIGMLDDTNRAELTAGMIQCVDPGRSLVDGASPQDASLLLVPVVEAHGMSQFIVFSGEADGRESGSVLEDFARTLTRLMSASLARIDTLHQITQAESKYRALFMASNGGIFRLTADGIFEDINPALAHMGGYATVEEMRAMVTEAAQVFAEPADRDRFLEQLGRNGCVKDFTLALVRRDGSRFPASLSARAVRNRHGELTAIEGVVDELTEARQRELAESELTQARADCRALTARVAELERANRSLLDRLTSSPQDAGERSGHSAADVPTTGGLSE
jgi:PAS domain S-box-containing protein